MILYIGSVDEKEDEQGIAHIVEHVTFLGSTRRDQLLGTGARSNAYTDFHHTVFHVHSPLFNNNVRNSGPMLPQASRLPSLRFSSDACQAWLLDTETNLDSLNAA